MERDLRMSCHRQPAVLSPANCTRRRWRAVRERCEAKVFSGALLSTMAKSRHNASEPSNWLRGEVVHQLLDAFRTVNSLIQGVSPSRTYPRPSMPQRGTCLSGLPFTRRCAANGRNHRTADSKQRAVMSRASKDRSVFESARRSVRRLRTD